MNVDPARWHTKLSRRDQDVIAAACSLLRRNDAASWICAINVLGFGDDQARTIWRVVSGVPVAYVRYERVRLYLYLRAVLRASSGDCGPQGRRKKLAGKRWVLFDVYEPITPLWQNAPCHDGRTPAQRRGGG